VDGVGRSEDKRFEVGSKKYEVPVFGHGCGPKQAFEGPLAAPGKIFKLPKARWGWFLYQNKSIDC
jgi:hypothetical protein